MFDSGFGGLTVARAVIDLLPNENVVYFGDTARYPYGSRRHDEVARFARQITDLLIEQYDPKMIVVACNTASAVALDHLAAQVDVPVIGVLRPGLESLLKVTLGVDTGWVYAWSPAAGFEKMPGTDAPMPNGIEKSDDERYIYLNSYSSQGVRKIDATTGETVANAEIDPVDNSTWGEDGRLLVASHTGGLSEMMACQAIEEGSCGMPFEIVALDPDDLSQQVLIAGEGAPMGGVTVALQRDGVYYLGTFLGDRLGIVDLSQ